MKFAFLAVIFLSVSCGKYDVPGAGGTVGAVKTYSPATVDSTTNSQLRKICTALTTKSNTLASLVNTPHTFTTVQTDCDDSLVVDNVDIATTIQADGANYAFKRSDNGVNFVFPQVDTASYGIMQTVCAQLASPGTVTSPYTLTSGEVQSVNVTSISTKDCQSNSSEICVLFETGTLSGTSYTVHTNEWVKFKIDDTKPRLGFYGYRKKVARSYCSENDSVRFEAILK